MRAKSWFAPLIDRIRVRFFSTGNHAVSLIDDPVALRRYQLRRCMVTIVGSISGGVGIGVSLSHSGGLSADTKTALGLPTLIGLTIALVFIFVRLPEVVRWLALLVVAAYFVLWKVDLDIELKLIAAFVGVVISLFLAYVLQFGLGVGKKAAENFYKSLAAVGLFALSFGAAQRPADAQTGVQCDDEELSLEVQGEVFVETGTQGAEQIPIRVPAEGVTFVMSAKSSSDFGTVTVELLETSPIPVFGSWLPVVGSDDRIVWVGNLGQDGAAKGETGPVLAEIRRRPGDLTYTIRSAAHEVPLQLMAGEGLYRATFADAETGGVCLLHVRVRILASPVATPVGIAGLSSAIGGLALLGSGLGSAGGLRGLRGRRNRLWPEPPVTTSDTSETFTLTSSEKIGSDAEGDTWEVTITPKIGERDHDLREVDVSEVRFLNLLNFNPVVALPGEVLGAIPIQVRTDPKKVKRNLLGFSVDLIYGGTDVMSEELVLTEDGFKFLVGIGKAALVDLRSADAEDTADEIGRGAALDEPTRVDEATEVRS